MVAGSGRGEAGFIVGMCIVSGTGGPPQTGRGQGFPPRTSGLGARAAWCIVNVGSANSFVTSTGGRPNLLAICRAIATRNDSPPSSMPAMHRSPRRPLRRTLRQRFEFRAARLLFSLPAAVQVRLSGRPPVVVDDCALHPQMQLLLALPQSLARPIDRGAAPRRGARELPQRHRDHRRPADRGRRRHRHRHRGRPRPDRRAPLRAGRRRRAAAAGLLPRRRLRARRPRRPRQPVPAHLPRCRHARALGRLSPRARAPVSRRRRRRVRGLPLGLRARSRRSAPCPTGSRSAATAPAATSRRWCRSRRWRRAAPRRARRCCSIRRSTAPSTRPSLELFREGFLIGRADIDWYHLQYTGSTVAQPDPAQNPLLAQRPRRPRAGADRHRRLRSAARRRRSLCRRAAAGGRAGGAEALRRDAARFLQHGDDQPGLRRRRHRDRRRVAQDDGNALAVLPTERAIV